MELNQSAAMKYLVKGGLPVKSQNKRNDAISRCSHALFNGGMTAEEFLETITFKPNEAILPMASYPTIMAAVEVDEEVYTGPNSETAYENEGCNECIICYTRRPNSLLVPCHHLKTCHICTEKIEAGSVGKFACPYCQTEVKQHIKVYNLNAKFVFI